MLAELTSNIQALSQAQFGLLLLVVVAFAGVGFFLWKKSFQHARMMEDMATSKIRSAAQGFVELSGIQHPLEGTPLSAPLTGSACTWWDYKIERREQTRNSKGQTRTRWSTMEKDTSVGFFHLRDETGEILVNPVGADVTPSLQRVWYGDARRPNGDSTSRFGASLKGRYRYTERIMRPGEPIYALGHFETWSNVPGRKERSKKRSEILAERSPLPPITLLRRAVDRRPSALCDRVAEPCPTLQSWRGRLHGESGLVFTRSGRSA